jgi:hypothetical protein
LLADVERELLTDGIVIVGQAVRKVLAQYSFGAADHEAVLLQKHVLFEVEPRLERGRKTEPRASILLHVLVIEFVAQPRQRSIEQIRRRIGHTAQVNDLGRLGRRWGVLSQGA